jgi:hypothetical protein
MTAAALVPTLGYSDEIVMDQLIKLRTDLKPLSDAHGVKLTFMPFLLKVTPAGTTWVKHIVMTVPFDLYQIGSIIGIITLSIIKCSCEQRLYKSDMERFT